MQSNLKEICEITSQRTQVDNQIYKDMSTFVFAEVASLLRKPPSLIIKLKGIGTWYLRKKRMEHIVNEYPPDFEKTDFTSDYGILQYENKVDLYNLFKDRLTDYTKYLKIRDEVREIRRKTQKIIPPINRED